MQTPYELIGQKVYWNMRQLFRDVDGVVWEVESDSNGRYVVGQMSPDDLERWDESDFNGELGGNAGYIGHSPGRVSVYPKDTVDSVLVPVTPNSQVESNKVEGRE
jgi:hypothetical protein